MINKLWHIFEGTAISLLKFYTTTKYYILSFSFTAFWMAFRRAFERDHNISFDIAYPILLLTVLNLVVMIIGTFRKKFTTKEALEVFMVQTILYWIFIKIIDLICYQSYMAYIGNSLLFSVLLHQAIVIRDNMIKVDGNIFPSWIKDLSVDKLKELFTKK